VPFVTDATRALGELLAEHFASAAVRSSGLAFPGPKGAALRRSNFRRVWAKACTSADLEVSCSTSSDTPPPPSRSRRARIRSDRGSVGSLLNHRHDGPLRGLFPRLEEAIGEGLDWVFRDSLAAWVRPETASTVHL
jgi:hypothetical protein